MPQITLVNKQACYLVEAHHDVGHVHPGCSVLIHLVEHVVSEQLQHVSVTRV